MVRIDLYVSTGWGEKRQDYQLGTSISEKNFDRVELEDVTVHMIRRIGVTLEEKFTRERLEEGEPNGS